jgi:hypothetical protein
MGIVFNKSAFLPSISRVTLRDATDRSFMASLPLLSKPFHRPFQYVGMSVADAAAAVDGAPNDVGNIIVENDDARLLLEAEGNFISYVEVDLKGTMPCRQDQKFDPEPMLGALSINPSELELVRSKTHCHTYYDHKKKLKINVMCVYDDGPISVAFSSKYYGM